MSSFDPQTVELYVAHVPGEATDEEIKNYFASQQGTRNVTESFFVSKKDGRKSAQVAIVRFGSHGDAVDAKLKLNRTRFKGNTLHVRWSQSQRVLWVGRLHDTVTNEQLLAAFSQFGPVQRALVVADPQKGASKCYGFVVFESKREATKALQRCQSDPFLIGPTLRPVKVDYARLEDGDEGYSEDMRMNRKGGATQVDPATTCRFTTKGSQENRVATVLTELEAEYDRLKASMRQKLLDLQNQIIVTNGPIPSIGLLASLAQDPSFGGGFLARGPAQAVPPGYPGVPRPGLPAPGAPQQLMVPRPAPPAAPPPAAAPGYVPGPRPPPGNPSKPGAPQARPGPRPPSGAPPGSYPAVSTLTPQSGQKRPGEASYMPAAKTYAVDYGTGVPATAPPAGQPPTMVQTLSYAAQQAPDPYAVYQTYPSAVADPAQQQQTVNYPQVGISQTAQYPGYDPNQYAGAAQAQTAYYKQATGPAGVQQGYASHGYQ